MYTQISGNWQSTSQGRDDSQNYRFVKVVAFLFSHQNVQHK